MTQFDELLFGPQYAVHGVPAIVTVNGTAHAVEVIDMTAGTEIERGGLALPEVKPAAFIRVATLATLGLAADALHDQTLLLNGVSWTIKNTHPKPGPDGRASGEWLLVLKDDNL